MISMASHLLYVAASSIQQNGQVLLLKRTLEDSIHLGWGREGSRPCTLGHLTGCMRLRTETAVLPRVSGSVPRDGAYKLGPPAASSRAWRGGRAGAQMAGTHPLRDQGWSDVQGGKCVKGTAEGGGVTRGHVRKRDGGQVNRRKRWYGESPLPSLLWESLQPGRSPRQRTGWFCSRETHRPPKKHSWTEHCHVRASQCTAHLSQLQWSPPFTDHPHRAPSQMCSASPLNGKQTSRLSKYLKETETKTGGKKTGRK